jgi:hypothetical protein
VTASRLILPVDDDQDLRTALPQLAGAPVIVLCARDPEQRRDAAHRTAALRSSSR